MIQNKQIDAITVEAMNNGAHYMFMYRVSTRASEIEVIGQKMPDYLSSLQAAVVTEDKCLVLSQKSLLSDKLKEADALRDDYYRAFKKAVKGSEGIPVPAIQEAAIILSQLIKDYRIDPKMQLDKETGLLMNLLDDLMGKNKTQVEALGLMPLVEELKKANDEVIEVTTQRMDESLKTARAVTDEAYRDLVKMINAYALVEGDAAYAGFIDYLNAEIVHYKREVLNQKATSSTTPTPVEPSEPEPEPEPENPDVV
ncbi:MAG: DUF6261 family protein [Parabacteroides sp.]|nr:DUF6261 family protein [Parabacteroides sp.]